MSERGRAGPGGNFSDTRYVCVCVCVCQSTGVRGRVETFLIPGKPVCVHVCVFVCVGARTRGARR